MLFEFGPSWSPFEIANDSRASVSVSFYFPFSNVPVERNHCRGCGGGSTSDDVVVAARRLRANAERTPCCVVVYTYYLRRSVARPNWSLVRCSPDTRIYRRPVSAQTLPSSPTVRCFPDERPRIARRRCTCECWTSVCANLVSASKTPANGNGRRECSRFSPGRIHGRIGRTCRAERRRRQIAASSASSGGEGVELGAGMGVKKTSVDVHVGFQRSAIRLADIAANRHYLFFLLYK